MKKFLFILAAIVLTMTACQTAPAEAVVVTVVHTQLVPATIMVEATRVVEVIRTVEATRLVEVVREVVVTATPAPTATPTLTATPAPSGASSTNDGFTPPSGLPTEKVVGISVLKVINETDETLIVSIGGRKSLRLQVAGGSSGLWELPEGTYTYSVYRDTRLLYSGDFSLTNPDKHDLVLMTNKAAFREP